MRHELQKFTTKLKKLEEDNKAINQKLNTYQKNQSTNFPPSITAAILKEVRKQEYMTPKLEKIGAYRQQKPGRIPIAKGTVSELRPFKKNEQGEGYEFSNTE